MRRSLQLLVLSIGVVVGCGDGAETASVENVVLVCLDTVRFDTLAMAQAAAEDDAAARRWSGATRLVRTQSTAPWTLPAVASVFTGLYPNEHRAGAFPGHVADIRKDLPRPLAKRLPTLADTLAEHGFETAGFVAHPWFRSHFGLQRGFETLDLDLYGAKQVIARTRTWLDERSARPDADPFFLYLHFMEAHRPVQLIARNLQPLLKRLPPELRERALAQEPAACERPASLACQRYLGYVSAVDGLRRSVADVLALLEGKGLLERTAVVVFSDHGEEFLDHVEERAERGLYPRDMDGLGHGHTLYQEQLHVPLAIWHPAIDPGKVALPSSLADVTPTLLGWLGVEPDWEVSGTDLGPLLVGAAEPDPRRPLFSSSVAFGPERATVVRGGRKRIGDGGSGAGALVFDLADDSREREPLEPHPASDLAALLADYRGGLRAPTAQPAQPTPEVIGELQALGYLEEAAVD